MQRPFYFGAAYYPELWDEEEIEADIARCREFGVNTLRIGEFAWSKMEPEEGKYDFSWLSRAVDKLHAAGIGVILCTPSCTPPRWLFHRYPETRTVYADGTRTEIFSRCHPCKTSPVMREKNRAIVTELAKRFGSHPGVIGWQIDNEIFPYNNGCYCPLCIEAFRARLKEKYGTIGTLNRKWGMARWSLEYRDFSDVVPYREGRWEHPSLRKAWWEFQCEQIYSYVEEQAEILHRYSSAPVGTDMMPPPELSHDRLNRALDVVQYNHYDRAEHLAATAFAYDFLRTIKDRPFWVTETQSNWNGSLFAANGSRAAGNCYANMWLPVAKGGEMNLIWLFRAHANGHEMAHGALFTTAGRAFAASEEFRRAACDMQRCAPFLRSAPVRSKIAMHYSSAAAKIFMATPFVEGFRYSDALREAFYVAFRHYNVDLIETRHALEGYSVLFSPFLVTMEEPGLIGRVKAWVEAGGTWIVGPMSDMTDEDVSKYTAAPFSFLEEFAGFYTQDRVFTGSIGDAAVWEEDGTPCGVSTCFDGFLPRGAESLACYTGGALKGLSAIVRRRVGKGQVIVLGSVPSHADLRRLAALAPIAEASENVILTERCGKTRGIVALETENRAGYVVLDGTYTELISGREVSGRVELAPYEAGVFCAK